LYLCIVTPNTDEYIDLINKNWSNLFVNQINTIKPWNNWGNKYHPILKWEEFNVLDFIDNWDEKIEEFSKIALDEIIKIHNRLNPIINI
jgi:hypothetical protein